MITISYWENEMIFKNILDVAQFYIRFQHVLKEINQV